MWDHCWSTARFHLRLTNRQFFALTPRQLHLLVERHREASEHQELLTGILAAAIVNHSWAHPKEPLPPAHFMPSQQGKVRRKAARPQPKAETRQQIAANVRSFFRAQIAAQPSS